MAFDTLTYARRLKQAGVPDAQAEAMADATRELVLQDYATKGDIAAVQSEIAAVRSELAGFKGDIEHEIAALRREIIAVEQRLMGAIDTMGLRLTVRMGGLIAIGVAVLAAIIEL